MKAIIYFIQFLKDDGISVGGGGIGTLISYLCPILEEMGHEVTVYQCAARPFDVMWGSTRVVGVPGYPGVVGSNAKVVQSLRNLANKQLGKDGKLEIFAADFFAIKNSNPLAICVQNGLAWDAAIDLLTLKKMDHTPLGETIFRYRCQFRGLRRFETCLNRVAVDLYFLNWYRSFRGTNYNGQVFYNPNPAPLSEWDDSRDKLTGKEPVRIIFARRFFPEKGTRIIADLFTDLLQKRPDIRITMAGEGEDDAFLKSKLAGDPRVSFICYRTEEALDVHRQHDIAVIPSLCGEATCLAVVEAMSAGCAVLATNMGGMITQIIDGYNGILCWPTAESIKDGLLRLLDFPEERRVIQKKGWETSQAAFNILNWKKRWREIIAKVIESNKDA